jgi:hypothetical protein
VSGLSFRAFERGTALVEFDETALVIFNSDRDHRNDRLGGRPPRVSAPWQAPSRAQVLRDPGYAFATTMAIWPLFGPCEPLPSLCHSRKRERCIEATAI